MGGCALVRGRQRRFSALLPRWANFFLRPLRYIYRSRYRLPRGPIVVGVALVAAGQRPTGMMAALALGQTRQQDVGGFCVVHRGRMAALATERTVYFVAKGGAFKPPRFERWLRHLG